MMMNLISIYAGIGIFIMLFFLAYTKIEKVAIAKTDRFLLFSLCCALVVAYPYFAIKAVRTIFNSMRKNIIEAEVVK
jgi:hypothetical protein